MDEKGIDKKSISHQREITKLANRKAEEFYYEAQEMVQKTLESKSKLSKTQVAAIVSAINTTSSSAEFLNFLKRQIGKARSSVTPGTIIPPPWVAPVLESIDSDEKKAFGDILLKRLEAIREEALIDAEKHKMDIDEKTKLCVLYLRQYLRAFEAHYLHQFTEDSGN